MSRPLQERSALRGEGTENVWVVVAAFNEEEVIRHVLQDLRQYYPSVVVVDDGSHDSTWEEALAAGATVLRHPVNLGQGAALQTGICYAVRSDAEVIVTFDADGQHDPTDVRALVEALGDSPAEIALGSRFRGSTTGMPLSRRLLLKAAAIFTSLTTGIWISDPSNGLRAFTARAADKLQLRQNGMAHASEILQQIKEQGLSYTEVPVRIRYTEYSKSKGQRGLDAVNIVMDLLADHLHR